jgi:hypothetical protein
MSEFIGGEYVGDDIEELVKQAGGGHNRTAHSAISAPMQRSTREIGKRGPLGFGSYSLAAGATQAFTARVQRAFHSDRLLVTSSAIGILVTSLKIGDEEQVLGGSVPAELYGVNALADVKPDDFSPAPAGLDITITLSNPTAGTITGTMGMKGYIKR